MALLLTALACAAPVSTMRSPYHLRVVEVRNDSDQLRTLKIEPAADQHLGSATTFTGMLRPGEVKVLYLYHGFEYDFRILDPAGFNEVTRTTVAVDRDMGLLFAGDSLTTGTRLVARIGEPTVTFADSLQESDPFGLRRTRAIEPDTSRGHYPSPAGGHVGERGNPEKRGTP
jgi:hypothetical protein